MKRLCGRHVYKRRQAGMGQGESIAFVGITELGNSREDGADGGGVAFLSSSSAFPSYISGVHHFG